MGNRILVFFLVNIIGLVQTFLFSFLLLKLFLAINYTLYPELIAHIIGVIVPLFTSYIGHKYFSFRKENY